jgi:hypothetical protein
LHERDKLYEFDSVKPKSNNEITKLPDVSLNSSKIKQQNQLNDSTNNRSIYLPSLKTLSREQSSHTIPTTPNNNLSPRIIIERDRIKAEEGAKLKNVIENLDSNKSKKENKNGGGGTGGSNRSKHNKKTKTKEELEMEKEAEENAKKVAEIKALKQRLIENKKQTEYKIDHCK